MRHPKAARWRIPIFWNPSPASFGGDFWEIRLHYGYSMAVRTWRETGTGSSVGSFLKLPFRFQPLLHRGIVLNGRRLRVLPDDAPSVHALHFCVCPPTIRWLVVALRIDSIKRLARRARPHVGQKVSEALPMRKQPAFAHADSFSAVVLVLNP